MAELSTGALEVAVEVGAIASALGSIEERAEAVLHALYRVVPFQAAQIALVNPRGSEPVSLVVHGYDDAVRAYFNSATVVEEYELLGLDRSRPRTYAAGQSTWRRPATGRVLRSACTPRTAAT